MTTTTTTTTTTDADPDAAYHAAREAAEDVFTQAEIAFDRARAVYWAERDRIDAEFPPV